MKKCLLVNPPFYRLYNNDHQFSRYPLALGYLSGSISEHTDWTVLAYNADFSKNIKILNNKFLAGEGFYKYLSTIKDTDSAIWGEISDTIEIFSPDVVGIYANTQNFIPAGIIAGIIKTIDKDTKVVVGGPHPSLVKEKVFECENIDISVLGEGETTITELLKAIENNTDLSEVNGIIYRDNGKLIKTPPRALVKDLDALCFPFKHAPATLKDFNDYPANAFKNIMSSRGCPFDCFFCSSKNIWSQKVRTRSVNNIMEEIRQLYEFGLRTFRFDDDTFALNKDLLFTLCDKIHAKFPDLKWECELHVNLVDAKTISVMKKSGCSLIQLGIESGNNEILKKIKKNITIEEAKKASKIIKDHRINLQSFYMIGFPYDTLETINDTFRAMKDLPSDMIIFSIFTPYPGTESFEICKERGLIDDNFDISLYNHQSPENCFSEYIPPETFKNLISKIERRVDNMNYIKRLKRKIINRLDKLSGK